MAKGNPDKGLVRAMIDLMNELGPSRPYDSKHIGTRLRDRSSKGGLVTCPWGKTPERSVNSHFSQNPHIFEHLGPDRYCLRLEYVGPREVMSDGELSDERPSRVEQTAYRVLRDSELVRRLRALHGDQCQICGMAIQLNDRTYSEAHCIKPLGKPHNGPNVAGNILVLCPNHHVLCDHGAIPLSREGLTQHYQHEVLQEFLDYHNRKIVRA